jgi:hypothetical protein
MQCADVGAARCRRQDHRRQEAIGEATGHALRGGPGDSMSKNDKRGTKELAMSRSATDKATGKATGHALRGGPSGSMSKNDKRGTKELAMSRSATD